MTEKTFKALERTIQVLVGAYIVWSVIGFLMPSTWAVDQMEYERESPAMYQK